MLVFFRLSKDFNGDNFVRLGLYLEKKEFYMKSSEHPVKGPKNDVGLYVRFNQKYHYIDNDTQVVPLSTNASIVRILQNAVQLYGFIFILADLDRRSCDENTQVF
jgi:hypothetical protein